MRILFTGGSGKAGRHVVAYLAAKGHKILNLDLVPLRHPGVGDLVGDITESGQMFNAMTTHVDMAEMEAGAAPAFDAVVHFAAVPSLFLKPENETYRVNVIGTYNVLEAACKLGIRKVIIASSETTYGVCFSNGTVDPKVLPLEEDYDIDPMDSYGMSKKVNEDTARSFQRRFGNDIYALRIGNVIEPHEYRANFPGHFVDPAVRRRNVFCYIDARDLGQIVDLALQKDGLGWQVFNATNDTNSLPQTNQELLARFFPKVPLSRPLKPHESLLSNRKIREVLGFREQHNWRNYVDDPTEV